MGKVDVGPYSGSAQCVVGAYMFSPTWNGIPMPSSDDVLFAVISGLAILGLFSALNKKLSRKQKVLAFVIPWIAYRVAGYLLMSEVPGCLENFATFEDAISPLSTVFMILAAFVIFKFVTRKK